MAKNIPKTVEFHNHHVVIAFQIKNPRKIHPKNPQKEVDLLHCSSNNNGTNAIKRNGAKPQVGHENPNRIPNNRAAKIFFGMGRNYNYCISLCALNQNFYDENH